MEESRVNVGVIEKLTGLQFFKGLPAATRDKLVNTCEATQLWANAPPPKKKPK